MWPLTLAPLSNPLTIGEERPLGEAELVAVLCLAGVHGPGVPEKATQADNVTMDVSSRQWGANQPRRRRRHLPTGAGWAAEEAFSKSSALAATLKYKNASQEKKKAQFLSVKINNCNKMPLQNDNQSREKETNNTWNKSLNIKEDE